MNEGRKALDLGAIEARVNAAVPGPWTNERHDYEGSNGPTFVRFVAAGPNYRVAEDVTKEDGDFIAHAREDVPTLVAEVRRLRDALAESEKCNAIREDMLSGHGGRGL